MNNDFYRGKRVFITGHTGFKGTWLTRMLLEKGAVITGFALPPYEEDGLFNKSEVESEICSVMGDIRDFNTLYSAFTEAKPEIVFHLAAQPIVLESYKNPLYTYETNVLGTLNLLECIRKSDYVRSVVNVTTDKVYKNEETGKPFLEEDKLDGFDPYSNSKSCSELVTHSYFSSFLKDAGIAVSTMRAGNVIGGGDMQKDRLIPDCIRAAIKNESIEIRNPYSVRPFQFVLEPLSAYIQTAERQYENPELSGAYNIGPNDSDCVTAGTLSELFCKAWGEGASWHTKCTDGPHEAKFLKLNCDKLKATFGWEPCMNIDDAVALTVDYAKRTLSGENAGDVMTEQIAYFERRKADV